MEFQARDGSCVAAVKGHPLNALLTASSSQLKFRTIWISDIHLGTRGCKAEFLLDFFRHTESQYLYLFPVSTYGPDLSL